LVIATIILGAPDISLTDTFLHFAFTYNVFAFSKDMIRLVPLPMSLVKIALRHEMLGRLADLLYFVGCGLAGFLIVLAVIAARISAEHGGTTGAFFIAAAVLAWLGGRACRYVLAGR
jgi:hypothetical protein